MQSHWPADGATLGSIIKAVGGGVSIGRRHSSGRNNNINNRPLHEPGRSLAN
jgi:hypothetical protein